ncbi:MAG: RecX family transcriptional regulator [Deltaproteobacteria bacterium]|nr:RecX family transcriptional regulator [Deltaproteobacteria bacterium]
MPEAPADSHAAAFAAAVAFLARAAHSEAEVAKHLAARRIAPDLVAATLERLVELGYVDDDALAERRAEELLLRRGAGRLKVAHELTRRGLTDSVVDRAIAGVLEGRSEVALGRAALGRRFGTAAPASRAERSKAFRFLLGRGHPPDIVSEILGEDD